MRWLFLAAFVVTGVVAACGGGSTAGDAYLPDAGDAAAVETGGTDVTEAGEAADPGMEADDGRVPIAQVAFAATQAPAWEEPDLDQWPTGDCEVVHHTEYPYWVEVSCPALEAANRCLSVHPLGRAGAWLAPGVPFVECWACPPNGAYPCVCNDGVGIHNAGLGGTVGTYLFRPGEPGPVVLKSQTDLAASYAPVATAAAALAFAELTDPRVRHLFTHQEFLDAGSSGQPLAPVARCDPGAGTVKGTWVEAAGEDFIVHTFRVPDWNGCTDVAIAAVDVTVRRSGEVATGEATPLCFAQMDCHD
jgi:hypothetical protein